MSLRLVLCFVCVIECGCGPGVSDYTSRVGSTSYEVAVTDSENTWLYPRRECGSKCPSIQSNVVWVKAGPEALAVRRQVVQYYKCQEGFISGEILNRYEEYVIGLANNDLHGPMTGAEYQSFVAEHPKAMVGIEAVPATALYDGRGEVLKPMGRCTNPKPI